MWNAYRICVTILVRVLAAISGLGVLVMLCVIFGDILLKNVGHPIPGALDMMQIAACVTAVCALPYTTAVKGHVAVEFFFSLLPEAVKPWIDGSWRLVILLMYALMTYSSIRYGYTLMIRRSGTLTLQIPTFWLLWLMALSFAVMTLIKLYNITHPGKEMMKP